MHRTQVLLEEESYARLREESARTGRSIGDLVRGAVAQRAPLWTRNVEHFPMFADLSAPTEPHARRAWTQEWNSAMWCSLGTRLPPLA